MSDPNYIKWCEELQAENAKLKTLARAVVEDAYDNHGILETRFAPIRQEVIDALAVALEVES